MNVEVYHQCIEYPGNTGDAHNNSHSGNIVLVIGKICDFFERAKLRSDFIHGNADICSTT